jgi:ABC-type uncharacterized transport system permease subunit
LNAVYLLSNLGLLGFALAAVVYLVSFQEAARPVLLARVAFSLFVLATLGVTGAAALQLASASLGESAAVLLTAAIAWLAIVGHLAFNMRIIGAFVAPLSTLILLIKFFVAPMRLADAAPRDGNGILLTMHVAPAILGQAFAIIACAVSIVYLWQQNLLKKKLLDQLPRNLPAIDRLDRILAVSLWCGFLFITLGLLSGALYAQLNPTALGLNLPAKVIWAVLVWVWYLATLLARNVFNRPSKRIAQMSLGGFMLLLFTYFGMGFLRPLGGG